MKRAAIPRPVVIPTQTQDDIAFCFALVAMIAGIVALCIFAAKNESAWEKRCQDAGGVPLQSRHCVRPGSVIEVK